MMREEVSIIMIKSPVGPWTELCTFTAALYDELGNFYQASAWYGRDGTTRGVVGFGAYPMKYRAAPPVNLLRCETEVTIAGLD